ncbi:hypothetical protein Poli38472_012835 [Pythium oligandrum]|uniref:ELYS-like domain-containing protein n=1 Tax=Pythium oligandrum TaxID=41045 RepID=A0A8K1FN22_PYTOL|nr:hypothetical protein Poli38472_012835 [Pythium oligandrum]|eukprot:TMW64213.1 hypothetical protein Poli38472_012835 [Pythium oligandrum]
MLLPVIERFAELGWQPFVDPGETYELFSVSGIFKRANVETKELALPAPSGSPHLAQRNALFDVCLSSGLAHLIVSYIRAAEPATTGSDTVVGKKYVLTEPIAVQQWVRRRVEALEKLVHADASAFSSSGGHARESLDQVIRELSGLRAVSMTLVERLKETSRQIAANTRSLRLLSSSSSQPEELLKQTELAHLTTEGIQNLLEMLYRIQVATMTCQCLEWFREHDISLDGTQYQEFYYQARTSRSSLRQSFEGSYQATFSSISNSDIEYPSLLIELVMQNANVLHQMSLPPSTVSELIKLLHASSVQEDIANFYSDEVEKEPLEGYFRVQSALLLYFVLDLAYLSLTAKVKSEEAWTGWDLVQQMTDVADSFAAQMGVRDDMKTTLLAIWLIENAVNVHLTAEDEVAPVYFGAVTRLLESSATHLQKKSGLEADLIVYMVETLVHRGESSFAWKIWTAFELDLASLPSVATEYAVMVNLELGAWERALSLLRAQGRLDLLPLLFKWLARSGHMKELVQSTTLTATEETQFDQFMMSDRATGEHVLQDAEIRKADLLVMYYVLRNQFDRAWAVHHEHLALIRESTAGDMQIAQAVLTRSSFRIRTALLQNMRVEPTDRPSSYNFKRNVKSARRTDADVLMLPGSTDQPMSHLRGDQDDEMADVSSPKPPATPQTSKSDTGSVPATPAVSSLEYSPGIYSSRSSQPRSNSGSGKKQQNDSFSSVAATPTDQSTALRNSVPIGSIDSSPGSNARVPAAFRRQPVEASLPGRKAAQTLNFSPSPVAEKDAAPGSSGKTKSPQLGEHQQIVTPPVRSRFNASFSSVPAQASPSSNASTDDLALRVRRESIDATPVNVQVGTRESTDNAADAAATSAIAATASTAAQEAPTGFATPKRFQFVREAPQTDSRLFATKNQDDERSPASQELDTMELEAIDEEFSTPSASSRRKEPSSVPTRRNPRRQSRNPRY